jgi:hypothetical protein
MYACNKYCVTHTRVLPTPLHALPYPTDSAATPIIHSAAMGAVAGPPSVKKRPAAVDNVGVEASRPDDGTRRLGSLRAAAASANAQIANQVAAENDTGAVGHPIEGDCSEHTLMAEVTTETRTLAHMDRPPLATHMWHASVPVTDPRPSTKPLPVVILPQGVVLKKWEGGGYALWREKGVELLVVNPITYYDGTTFWVGKQGVGKFTHQCTHTQELQEGWYVDACDRQKEELTQADRERGWAHMANSSITGNNGTLPATVANCEFKFAGTGEHQTVTLHVRKDIAATHEACWLLVDYHYQLQWCGLLSCSACC